MDRPRLPRIDSESRLDDLFRESDEHPVWIFKHSLVCPTSARALEEFERFAAGSGASGRLGVVDIQEHRALSAEIERRTGVRHESPQAILLSKRSVRWHASHWMISEEALRSAEADERAAGGA